MINNYKLIFEVKMSRLESGIKIDLECKVCQDYKNEIKTTNERTNILAKFEKSSKSLKDLLNSQRSFGDKAGLGYNSCESSTSKSKQNKFVKPLKQI